MNPAIISDRKRTGHVVVAVGLFAVALLTGCPSARSGGETDHSSPAGETSAHALKGAKAAREAIAADHLKLKEWPPLPYPASHQEYVELLKERCHVDYEVSRPPPSISEADFVQEVRAWNATMEAEIKHRFGADIFERLHAEAEKNWEKKLGR